MNEELFAGQKYCRTKDQKLLSDLPKLKVKMSKLGDVLSKLVLLKRITDGGLGAKLPEAYRFFWKKHAILMPLEYISHAFWAI